MSWVRRKSAPMVAHHCDRPEHGGPFPTATAARGVLWRCNTCGTLWEADYACPACRQYGHRPHGGQHVMGNVWRPAGWWARLIHPATSSEGERDAD